MPTPITHPSSSTPADRSGLAEALGRRAEVNRARGAGFGELLSDATTRAGESKTVGTVHAPEMNQRDPHSAAVSLPRVDLPGQAADAARQATARAAERYAAAAAARTER